MTIQSICGTWTVTWPWPRVFFLEHYILGVASADWSVCQGGAVTSNSLVLFEMTYLYGSWKATPVYELGAIVDIDSIEIADFGPFYVLSACKTIGNSSSGLVIVRDSTADAGIGSVSLLPTDDIPSFVTCCNFKGQLIVGGILESINYAGYSEWEDLGVSHVAWSGIKNYTFRPDIDPTAGFCRVWWSRGDLGKVFSVKPVKDRVMVFGDLGLMALDPFSAGMATGFALKYVRGHGIQMACHVAGDENVVFFIDKNKDLWMTQDGEKMELLGYREFINGLTNADIILTYVPQKKRLFISDGVKGYCLTEQGLYSTNQCICSAGIANGEYVGLYADNADYKLRLETNTYDFKQRGKKTLEVIEVGGEFVNSTHYMDVATKYKNDYNSSTFTTSTYKKLNPNGFAFPIVTADEFRLLIRGGDYRNAVANISHLKGRIKMVDKRSIRGLSDVSQASK